ncbi:speriolin isoform X1 [Antechinus flavipes]|uniref:speriolin isoform X1 n=1 Tax=Antechinus flavipes TaxID=38775 RepID=UPI002235B321|nr:speriolin isoform X1 [Antechinus flavipes]
MSPTSPGLRPRPPERCSSSSISTPVPPIMSLLSNYEGLRHQIERLVRENEELKKLVRLIRENHELKSAIKTQAGAMGISGISSMFNEGTSGSTLQTTDRTCPTAGPVSTNDPGLDELGLLSSLVDILNYSQSSSSTSPATSPTSSPIGGSLPYPLNNTIPGSVAVLPNNPLLNFLAGNLNNPLAGSIPASPNALLANPLQSSRACPSTNPVTGSGTVSTATGTSGNPLTVPPSGPLTVIPMTGATNSPPTGSHPPVTSTGSSLEDCSTGSMSVPPISPLSSSLSNPLCGPMAVPPISPLSSSLSNPLCASSPITSMSNTLTGALNDPQDNLLPKPRANHTLLNDPSRPHSPLDAGCHSPTASAAPSTTVPKVIISTEGNKITMGWEPSLDVKPYNMAIVGQPIQTSTPTITVGTPVATFYRCPEASTQGSPSIAAMSSLLTSVPLPGTIPISTPPVPVTTTSSQPVATATSLHQSAPTSSPSTLNAAICQDTSNTSQRNILQPTPRNALAAHATLSLPHPYPSPPPRSCTSSSSANNARGARSSEPPNKNLLEMERKMAHRKTLKVNETPRDPKQLTWERLVGEIAFQLDRRILSNIFPERVRLYGFTVSNIPEKIIQASLNTSNHKLDEELCQTLTQRYVSVMNRLQSLGYNGRVHPGLTEQLVNAYGILRERPELAASEGGCYTMDFLQRVVTETVPPSMLNDALLLLSCLNQLSQDDGKPMFIW